MSGKDERPTFKITKESFFKLCPSCHSSDTYVFRKNENHTGWYGRVGTIQWANRGLVIGLVDYRTTAKSIGKKYLKCGSCKETISFDTKIGTMLLELFRDDRANRDGVWRRQLEKLRVKEPVKVWWKIKQ